MIFTVILQFYAHYIKLKLEADGLEVMREQNVIHWAFSSLLFKCELTIWEPIKNIFYLNCGGIIRYSLKGVKIISQFHNKSVFVKNNQKCRWHDDTLLIVANIFILYDEITLMRASYRGSFNWGKSEDRWNCKMQDCCSLTLIFLSRNTSLYPGNGRSTLDQ